MRLRRADQGVDIDLAVLDVMACKEAARRADKPVRLVEVAERHEDPLTGRIVVVPREPLRISSRWGVL